MRPKRVILVLLIAVLSNLHSAAFAWNSSGHMLSGSIAYQILRRESAITIEAIKTILEKHPRYANHWQAQLEKVPSIDRDEMLFMLAPRWADDIRTKDRSQDRGPWHYINFPFKPNGQPENVHIKPPAAVNILTALAENERIAKADSNAEKRAIALTWIFHLVGDIHQPLHTVQVFTTDYPNGDRGGNEICVQPSPTRKPMNLHRFWDDALTSRSNVPRLRNDATALRNRQEFSKSQLTELASTDFESWAKESLEIAVAITYQNGALAGTPKKRNEECSKVQNIAILPTGYTAIAKRIADRRIILAGYRLADLLRRLFGG